MYILLVFVLVLCNCMSCWTCTYPSELVGEWYSTSFGTLNFVTSQSFSGFTSALSATPLTFTCYDSSGSQYVSMSSIDITGLDVEVYLCMDLQKISAIKYLFRLDSNRDVGTGVRFYTSASSGDTVTLSQACSRSDTRSAGEYELLVRKDQISSAVISCPTHFHSTFNVTLTTSAVDNCQGTYLYGSSGALVFNFSSCVTGQFNNVGYLQCMYSFTDTYSYVTLYNNETTTDEISTYKFTCLAYEKDGEMLKATESPNSCQPFQSPSAVDNPGISYVMTDLLYTREERDYTTIIIVVCVIAGTIIIIVVVIVVYIKFCRKPKPEQPRPRKPKRKPSVTEYTPRILRGGKSVESLDKSAIHKQSTEEIITGVLADKKHDSVLRSGDSYEPPKKEAWQRKWEDERNKVPSRLSQESLLRLKHSFSSDRDVSRLEKLSVSDLDKAYTLSTSLPESLDIPVKPSPRQTHLATTDTITYVSTLNTSNKYSEKSHASTSIPASTGKFGGSPKIRSTESVHLPSAEPKLDTISENPLSRENTAPAIQPNITSRKQLKEHPNLTCLVNSDIASLSTVLASQSTASGWQYKWEIILRPKKVTPVDKHESGRSKTPVNLFQNVNVNSHAFKAKDNVFRENQKENRNSKIHQENDNSEKRQESGIHSGSFNKDNDEDLCNTEVENIFDSKLDLKTLEIQEKNKDITVVEDNLAILNETDSHVTHSKLSKFENSSESQINIHVSDILEDCNSSENANTLLNKDEKCPDALMIGARTLDKVRYDSVSLHSELFFPENWLYESCSAIDQLWKTGAKCSGGKRSRAYKRYLGIDEDMVQKKETNPFKKYKTN